jgi:hypothetical protein
MIHYPSLNANPTVLIIAGPLKTATAVSIDEYRGSKSLAGEHNEGNAIIQPSKVIIKCINTTWVIKSSLVLFRCARGGGFSGQERRI